MDAATQVHCMQASMGRMVAETHPYTAAADPSWTNQ
jgi:hypothetical protein